MTTAATSTTAIDAADSAVASPVLEVLRDISRGGSAGILIGLVGCGIGGRLVMRLAALLVPGADGRFTENGFLIGNITVGGTVALLINGLCHRGHRRDDLGHRVAVDPGHWAPSGRRDDGRSRSPRRPDPRQGHERGLPGPRALGPASSRRWSAWSRWSALVVRPCRRLARAADAAPDFAPEPGRLAVRRRHAHRHGAGPAADARGLPPLAHAIGRRPGDRPGDHRPRDAGLVDPPARRSRSHRRSNEVLAGRGGLLVLTTVGLVTLVPELAGALGLAPMTTMRRRTTRCAMHNVRRWTGKAGRRPEDR